MPTDRTEGCQPLVPDRISQSSNPESNQLWENEIGALLRRCIAPPCASRPPFSRMPLYEYECSKCGDRFEIIQRFSDDPVQVHSEGGDSACDGSVRKLLAAPAIQFKGTGWYVTDYGRAGKNAPKESGESGEKKSAKSAESAAATASSQSKQNGTKSSKVSSEAS